MNQSQIAALMRKAPTQFFAQRRRLSLCFGSSYDAACAGSQRRDISVAKEPYSLLCHLLDELSR